MILALLMLGALASLSLLETATRRPFLASSIGRAFAMLLNARRVEPHEPGDHLAFITPARAPAFLRLAVDTVGVSVGQVIIFFGATNHTPGLERHEATHSKQASRWGTLPFVVAYVTSWAWHLVRVGNARSAYYRIPFEVEAYRAQHGPDWHPPA